jgi:putative flippase GtrA
MTRLSAPPPDDGAPSYPAPPAGMRGTPGPLLQIVKDQRIAFVIVGAANTGIGTGFYIFFLSLHVAGYLGALVAAHVCAVLCAFVLYRYLVFRVRGHVLRDLWRFELVNLTSLGVNAALLPIAVEVFGLGPLVGQLGVTFVTMFISFFGHRDFSFRRKPMRGHEVSGAQTPAGLA